MKIDKTPTTIALLVFSWLIAISAISISGYLIIFKFGEARSLIGGLSILLGGLLLAAAIRMLGDIGQMLFDLKAFLINDFHRIRSQDAREIREVLKRGFFDLNQDLGTRLQTLNQDLGTQLQTLNQDLGTQLLSISNNCEQINCDLKDINQHIYQIKAFFEQIERHLDLKK